MFSQSRVVIVGQGVMVIVCGKCRLNGSEFSVLVKKLNVVMFSVLLCVNSGLRFMKQIVEVSMLISISVVIGLKCICLLLVSIISIMLSSVMFSFISVCVDSCLCSQIVDYVVVVVGISEIRIDVVLLVMWVLVQFRYR